MSVLLAGRKIERVGIADNDRYARKSVESVVEAADMTPLPEDGPLPDLDIFVRTVMKATDAFICEHRLKHGEYARFDGAEAAACFYKSRFPAVLCTAWGKADADTIRKYRPYIPALIPARDADPDNIIRGFELCILEFRNQFTPSRKPWRTLVRVEDADTESIPALFYIILPGWNSREIIRLPLDLIPPAFRDKIRSGTRFHALVNKGAETQEELYFDKFEFD